MAESELNKSRRRTTQVNNSVPDFDELNVSIPTYPYKSSSEYAAAVNNWLWQCYNWQYLTVTLPCLMSQTAYRMQSTNSSDGTIDFNRNFPNTFFPNQNFSVQPQRANGFQLTVTGLHNAGGVYLIPSLFKRLLAEAIDFCILLIFKVLITYVAVDFFDIVNLDKYDIELIKSEKIDYQTAMEVTSEILALEIIHRFVVCIFEAMWTQRGTSGPGGATPGKIIMKLRVLSCETITPLDGNMVRITPAGDLGLGWALVRAFIKNFSYAFIFPICCTMYFFQHNRTAYDHMCGSIVVEDLPRRTAYRH